MSKATRLECSLCARHFEAGTVRNLCECGGPLLVRYDLDAVRSAWKRDSVAGGPASMWRYAPVLPPDASSIVSLGEGWTPLLRTARLGARLGAESLWVKDEGLNPTGSFKARGLACAVSMCVELGIRKVAIPSAGNAASAMAAYAAAAGIEAHIYMPADVPQANYIECKAFGARVTLVDGLISDCGRMVAERAKSEGWFDVSTLKEPYRIEGKKTMGYEVAEQMGWELPDAIFYPTGGGVGLIGMWKAFDEMEALGWIGPKRPKMIAVQVEGCRPVVRAYEAGEARSTFWEDAWTVASGLRVPKPLGDFLILDAVRKSGGTAIAVSDAEVLDAGIRLATEEGIFAAPEGAACVAALEKLLASGFLKPADRIVIYNTGSGLKYLEAYSTRFPRSASGEQDKLGGADHTAMKQIALEALDAVARRGVEYADVRAVEVREREVTTKSGKLGHAGSSESLGVGIRVLAGGSWGFAATDDLDRDGIEKAAALAIAIARAGRAACKAPVVLAPEEKYEAVWVAPVGVDPFAIPVDRNLDVLLAVDAELRRNTGVSLSETSMHFEKRRQVFASTLGSVIDQTRTMSGAGFSALSYKDGEIQKRSYPNSFGGQYQLKGYELVDELQLLKHAARIADEAVALHSADQCPEGEFDLILDGSQLGLQIHESVGHPIELDRVLGSEANYAGMSFLTLDKLNALRYGSPVVNVVCDARLEHGPGLGTFAFDDEGVPAQCTPIISEGRFTGYMTSRETAAAVGDKRSNGTMRADGWGRIPLIRMTNVSLLPGAQSLEEVFDADHAIYMETNRSWSIDDKRYNFQFGCEIAWEMRKGRRVRMLKNPSYSGISTEFWNACDAIASREHWTLWGVPNCGKGQPEQVMGTGHGASPSRFRKIRVGSAYAG